MIIKTEAVTKNIDLHLNPPSVPEDFFLATVGCFGVGSRPTAEGRSYEKGNLVNPVLWSTFDSGHK